jgi:CelD/BcsL family acetyltransferase involved in cellulose biosynthesis
MTEITLSKVTDFEQLGELWRDLESRSDASFFQSWAWTGCLVEERFSDPVLLRVHEGDRVTGLALFNQTRPNLGRPRLWLGESGDRRRDDIFIEHNGILIERGFPKKMLAACLDVAQNTAIGTDRLRRRRIIRLSGVDEKHLAAARACHRAVRVRMVRAAPFVELDALRRSGTDSLEIASRNTRYQIRRSERRYAATGPLAVVRARSVEEAQFFLTELAQLHQAYWVRRGKPGAFANPQFERFHRTLIERTFAGGGTDLLRVSAGSKIVGYLYNLLSRGHVCAYQSGFDYQLSDRHYKPGLTCHHLAIEMYLAKGARRYDFLAGAERYKLSFANTTAPLYWIQIGQTGLRTALANGVAAVRNRLSR